MLVRAYTATDTVLSVVNPARVETSYEHHTGEQYKIIILDADDTLDVIIHYPNGEREAVWSIVKEPQP